MSVFFFLNPWAPTYSLSNDTYLRCCLFLLCRASPCTPVTITFLVKLRQGHRVMWPQTKPWITDTWITGMKFPSSFSRQQENIIFAENNIFLKRKFPFLILFVVVHSNFNKKSAISILNSSFASSQKLQILNRKKVWRYLAT